MLRILPSLCVVLATDCDAHQSTFVLIMVISAGFKIMGPFIRFIKQSMRSASVSHSAGYGALCFGTQKCFELGTGVVEGINIRAIGRSMSWQPAASIASPPPAFAGLTDCPSQRSRQQSALQREFAGHKHDMRVRSFIERDVLRCINHRTDKVRLCIQTGAGFVWRVLSDLGVHWQSRLWLLTLRFQNLP